MMRTHVRRLYLVLLAIAVTACDDDGDLMAPELPLDPATAPRVVIDRFSDDAGNLFVRSANSGLPAAGAAIDFDQAPFITQGFGPQGQVVRYYNFDVQPTAPAPIWVLFRDGSSTPVEGQLNIIDVIPGDAGYNDFWQVVRVTVPVDYLANTATSIQDLLDAGYAMETTNTLVNCPVVPEGSVASEGTGANGLSQGWYKDQLAFYFNFSEAPLSVTAGAVPTSPIFVAFNIDPDQPGGGPASGFMHQGSSSQSHNVLATLPSDAGYSPLWGVMPYDNGSFAEVRDLGSAQAAPSFGFAATVNCPVVFVGSDLPGNASTAQRAVIDRFSDEAGHLFVRSANSSLPTADAAIDFDQAPFITQGFGPQGQMVRYYNFDVQPTAPAPIWVLFHEGSSTPVPGQLNIIDAIPGDAGYNDFWQVVRVTVPAGYVANAATSIQDLLDAGYAMEATNTLVNCPVVPEGSVAREGTGANGLSQGWYKDQLAFYFNFSEAPLSVTAGAVPTSPIFVAFNIDPDQPGGGPASGFMHQGSSSQSHNVLATLPSDAGYSPLWGVMPYDNGSFAEVRDLGSAQAAPSFGFAATVNCPVVFVGSDLPGNASTAQRAVIDRFSDEAGHLFVRSANSSLPTADAAIDFDQAPFITQGFGPQGQMVRYYNFDVQPTAPAPIWVLFHEGSSTPVPGQLNIIDAIPGDAGYNDFWQVVRVTVPAGYVANAATSIQDLLDAGYAMEATNTLVNCPVVPEGSVAREGTGANGLSQGWYKDQLVFYFNFSEAELSVTAGAVPTSPIFVAFNVNPDQPGGGPASGFLHEAGSSQSHNVVATVPGDAGYSPLWGVMPYDNASFAEVRDLGSAQSAPSFGLAATVNCPIVFQQ